ncbi:unnamed protein product [Cyprideis torosa]|uniref:Uncharacterized protein n=1 Tax=Cyprideis torosa TaxID=163714 RepID=A0A7R8ZGE8_9CRUS|nr:unnamed protein product [Cyprideis torosa]CAG0879883.1 unnamed protein product [Cyprideis torosa]
MVESFPLDQIVATFGSTTLRLPGNIGCRSFLVKVRCASVEKLGDGQSKWYFLPSPSENNSLLIPALDPPTLMISSSQPMNSKQDPFPNLEDVRIDVISPREDNTSSTPQLLICTQQECSKDRKEGQLYDLRFKIGSKAPKGELWESCFTSVPPQQLPELKLSFTFKNTVAVSFRNLSDPTKQNPAFISEKENIITRPTKIHSTEFVPSPHDLLCPREIPEQPEEVIGSIGIQWSQDSIVYQRLELQILLQDLASAERFHSLTAAENRGKGLFQDFYVVTMRGLTIVLFVLFVFLNTDVSKAKCQLPGTVVNMGMMQMGKTEHVKEGRGRRRFGAFGPRKRTIETVTVEHPFTVEGVQIWLKTDKVIPLLEIQKIVKEDGNNDVRSISCIAFNEQKSPTHSSSEIPIGIERVTLESDVFTEHSMHGTRRTWVGKPTLKFTCQDLVQLRDLDVDNSISLEAFNAIIPPPVLEIYDSNELMVESYPLDQIVATFGSTTLRLPGNIGCRSFLVKVRCASVEKLGEGQSKWYFLPSPSENNSLLIPALDPPTLMISSSQPMNSKQDPFSNLEDVRIDIISPRENITPQLLICTQQECSKDRKEGQLYDLRFKIASKAANGELLESCFTSVPPQQMPQLKFSLTFKNTVAVSFRNLSDVTKQNAAFTSEKGNIITGKKIMLSTEFVPSPHDLLCPREIPEQPEEVIGSIGIQWSQDSIVYQRLALPILLQDLASAERFCWCSFDESTSVIHWKFAGVDDSCNIEFTVRYAYQKDDEQKLIVVKTRGVFDELNSTFHFGLHIGSVLPAADQHMDGMLIFNVSLTDINNKESSCSVVHNLTGPSRFMTILWRSTIGIDNEKLVRCLQNFEGTRVRTLQGAIRTALDATIDELSIVPCLDSGDS